MPELVQCRAIWLGLPGWEGSDVVILASGPSLTLEQCEQVRAWRQADPTRRVVVINNTYQRAPWADLLYACDAPWWRLHIADVQERFTGALWTQDKAAAEQFGAIHYIESSRNPGLGKRPGVIHQGGNSGYQAINLVVQAGARRIVLVGMDMRGHHWHGKHDRGLPNTPPWLFARWLGNFEALASDLEKEGVEVVNATPGSALQHFPMVALAEALS